MARCMIMPNFIVSNNQHSSLLLQNCPSKFEPLDLNTTKKLTIITSMEEKEGAKTSPKLDVKDSQTSQVLVPSAKINEEIKYS